MRFVIDQNNDGQFHWRLTGDDGVDLAVSPASFASATGRLPRCGRRAPARRLGAGA